MATTGARSAPQYPTTPAPLSREEFRGLAERRRESSSNLERAEAQRARDTGRQNIQHAFKKHQVGQEADRRRDDARRTMAGRGLALSPMGLGRELRTVRDWQAGQLAGSEAERADALNVLDEAVRQARQARDLEHGRVDADRARMQTELDRLLSQNF